MSSLPHGGEGQKGGGHLLEVLSKHTICSPCSSTVATSSTALIFLYCSHSSRCEQCTCCPLPPPPLSSLHSFHPGSCRLPNSGLQPSTTLGLLCLPQLRPAAGLSTNQGAVWTMESSHRVSALWYCDYRAAEKRGILHHGNFPNPDMPLRTGSKGKCD